MKQLITLSIEPATGENIIEQYLESYEYYSNELSRLKRTTPKSVYEKDIIEIEIKNLEKKMQDNRIHLASIKTATKYALIDN